ncbi:MAG TPA: hypothetical protein VER55_01555, partial [Ardenticatenaceae bacterium]|nr:hypothetical protein [Ardenticatenaceae bacterium]
MERTRGSVVPPAQGELEGRRRWTYRTWRQLEGYFFLLPNILGFLAFTAIPVLVALVVSFTDWNIFSAPTFVGLDNYRELL